MILGSEGYLVKLSRFVFKLHQRRAICHLFSGSVRENIRYGKLDATDEEVEAAARAVSADTVVSKLENGWDSDVGEGGDRLSTGEKQLISFARAVLADPRIFVLDEATSSIDTQTEQLIQNAIAANSAEIDGASGATMTSDGFREAVAQALAKAQ